MPVYVLNASGRVLAVLLLCLVDQLLAQNVVSSNHSKRPTCNGQYRCTDGTRVPGALDRCPNGCTGNAPKKCLDGSCISPSSPCERNSTTNGCTGNTPKMCLDGSCISSSSSCERNSTTNGCSHNQRKCPDGCIYHTQLCCQHKCQDGEFVSFRSTRCSNGCRYWENKCSDGTCKYKCSREAYGNASYAIYALPLLINLCFCGCCVGRCRKKRSSPTIELHNGTAAETNETCSSDVAEPPPTYENALNDRTYPPVQPQKRIEDGLPTYDSVAHIKPEEPSGTPVSDYLPSPRQPCFNPARSSSIYTIPIYTDNCFTPAGTSNL